MKSTFALLVLRRLLTVAVATLAPMALHAHDERPKPAHGDHEHGPPAGTAASTWVAISQIATQLESLVDAQKLEGVHDQTEALTGALRTLVEKSTDLGPDKRKRLEAAVRQAVTIADQLHGAADGAEQKRAAEEWKRLKAALSLVEAQLPNEALPAAQEHP